MPSLTPQAACPPGSKLTQVRYVEILRTRSESDAPDDGCSGVARDFGIELDRAINRTSLRQENAANSEKSESNGNLGIAGERSNG